MMRIAIYTRGEEYLSDEEFAGLLALAEQGAAEIFFNEACVRPRGTGGPARVYASAADLPPDTALVVSYGGDGTFLQCVRMLDGRDIPVMGINSGRLGFLANVPRLTVGEVFARLEKGGYRTERRSVIEAEGVGYALNEFTIQKDGANMVRIGLSIDGEEVATYEADGLIVSTPTGSTAYAMSAGGPILAPSCDCMVVIPIAPHNLTVRPLVVDGSARLRLTPYSRTGRLLATLDNAVYPVRNGDAFTVVRRQEGVRIAQLAESTFYQTIRNKLMWGIDGRNK